MNIVTVRRAQIEGHRFGWFNAKWVMLKPEAEARYRAEIDALNPQITTLFPEYKAPVITKVAGMWASA